MKWILRHQLNERYRNDIKKNILLLNFLCLCSLLEHTNRNNVRETHAHRKSNLTTFYDNKVLVQFIAFYYKVKKNAKEKQLTKTNEKCYMIRTDSFCVCVCCGIVG